MKEDAEARLIVKETIVAIREFETKRDDHGNCGMSGFVITTTSQQITLAIGNETSCREEWGYFMTEDATCEFIGEELVDITITNTALNTTVLDKIENSKSDTDEEANIMFVDIKTTKGVLQFVAYNAHNGYYGHKAVVKTQQFNYEEYL